MLVPHLTNEGLVLPFVVCKNLVREVNALEHGQVKVCSKLQLSGHHIIVVKIYAWVQVAVCWGQLFHDAWESPHGIW